MNPRIKDEIRRACIRAMKGESAITSLIPAEQIFQSRPPHKPTWPFIQYGIAIVTGRRTVGGDGASVLVAIHVYAKGPGDEACGSACGAVAAYFDGGPSDDGGPRGRCLDISAVGPGSATASVLQARVIEDGGEANAWHGIVSLLIDASV